MNSKTFSHICLGLFTAVMAYLFFKELKEADEIEAEKEFTEFTMKEDYRELRRRIHALEHPNKSKSRR